MTRTVHGRSARSSRKFQNAGAAPNCFDLKSPTSLAANCTPYIGGSRRQSLLAATGFAGVLATFTAIAPQSAQAGCYTTSTNVGNVPELIQCSGTVTTNTNHAGGAGDSLNNLQDRAYSYVVPIEATLINNGGSGGFGYEFRTDTTAETPTRRYWSPFSRVW